VRRPSPALVVASAALLVALSGTSYATVLNVPKNSVGTSQLKRNAVKPTKLAPNAVRTAHVLNGSLLGADFKVGQIPQGPKGDKGDKGDRGDKGDPGSPGVSGHQIVANFSDLNSANLKSIFAECPAGKKVTGGGGLVSVLGGTAAQDDLAVSESWPTPSQTAWLFEGVEVVPTAGTWRVTAYAVCANVAG
jgi:hypothetical protein